MKSMIELIRGHHFLADLDSAMAAVIAGCAKNELFEPSSYLLREGQPADQFYLIRTGHVAMEIYSPRRGAQVVQTLGPDEVLGETWIVPPYRAAFDARAVDQVRTFSFDATCLRGKCEADPALGYALMKRFVPVLVQRLSAARLQALDLFGAPA